MVRIDDRRLYLRIPDAGIGRFYTHCIWLNNAYLEEWCYREQWNRGIRR